MSNKGRSLELYFINGKPDGMLTATVPFQWTGHVLMTSRNQISEALDRKETARSGVYLLFGENEEGPLAYIGETEEIRQRIKDHAQKKDWWTSAVMITDTGDELNKAHVKYLESRLLEIARDVGKIRLENNTVPPLPSLSEASTANMEGFLDNILLVLPAVRIDCFVKETRLTKTNAKTAQPDKDNPVFEIISKKGKVEAQGVLEDGSFVVLKGSKIRMNWVGQPGKYGEGYEPLFHDLVKRGILVDRVGCRVFAQSYAFKSPSAAGAVVMGRATNGPTTWKIKGSSKSYKQWEMERLS